MDHGGLERNQSMQRIQDRRRPLLDRAWPVGDPDNLRHHREATIRHCIHPPASPTSPIGDG
jgi:hypothetical protein